LAEYTLNTRLRLCVTRQKSGHSGCQGLFHTPGPIAASRDVTTCPLLAKADKASLTTKSQLARLCLFVEAAAVRSQ
jgi:hypothetical protein